MYFLIIFFFTDLEIPDDKTGITVYVPLLCVDMSFCQSDNAIASDSWKSG